MSDDFDGSSIGDLSDVGDGGEGELLSFTPVLKMPSGRLQDILDALMTKEVGVVNLDAIIPISADVGVAVLQTLLHFIKPSVKTLSLRFNNFNLTQKDMIVEWISSNNHLETLYVMGSGFEGSIQGKLETAWRKNLSSQRTDNLGNTFIRVLFNPNLNADDE